MTIQEILVFCNGRSKKNKYFVAPQSILKELEQEKIDYSIERDIINVMNKKFRIERSVNNAY